MALSEEDFKCICGAEFDSIGQLQAHWNTDTRETTGRPHYRLTKLVGEFGFPPMRDDSLLKDDSLTEPEEP